jgi:hypothetical protein
MDTLAITAADGNIASLVTLIKDVLNATFFVVVGLITILTYRRARETLLQPIKTEVFKYQLEELSAILKHFVGKGEIELRAAFAFNQLEHANVCMMFDAYARRFFDLDIPADRRPYDTKTCPTTMFTREFMERHFVLADGHVKAEVSDRVSESEVDPRVRAALWADYVHGGISLPRQYSERVNEFTGFLESPLLPRKLGALIEDYLRLVNENVRLIADTLTVSAKEMPEKYPSLNEMERATTDWIHHRYNREFKQLKPKADEIIGFIRSYYGADQLVDLPEPKQPHLARVVRKLRLFRAPRPDGDHVG